MHRKNVSGTSATIAIVEIHKDDKTPLLLKVQAKGNKKVKLTASVPEGLSWNSDQLILIDRKNKTSSRSMCYQIQEKV